MTRHANAARDLAALLADASPDVAQANADTLLARRSECRRLIAEWLAQSEGQP